MVLICKLTTPNAYQYSPTQIYTVFMSLQIWSPHTIFILFGCWFCILISRICNCSILFTLLFLILYMLQMNLFVLITLDYPVFVLRSLTFFYTYLVLLFMLQQIVLIFILSYICAIFHVNHNFLIYSYVVAHFGCSHIWTTVWMLKWRWAWISLKLMFLCWRRVDAEKWNFMFSGGLNYTLPECFYFISSEVILWPTVLLIETIQGGLPISQSAKEQS